MTQPGQGGAGATQVISLPPFTRAQMLQIRADMYEAMALNTSFDVISDKNNINFEWPTLSEGAVHTDVGEFETVNIENAKFGLQSFKIKKDVGHVMVSDEAAMMGATASQNIMERQRAQLGPAFAKGVEKKMLTAIKKIPQLYTATVNWAVSANNPLLDLGAASLMLETGNTDSMNLIMNPLDAMKLMSNEFILKYVASEMFSTRRDKLAEFNLIKDKNNLIPSGKAYLTSTKGVGYWVDGREFQEPYRDIQKGGDGHKVTYFNGVSGPLELVGKGATAKNAGVVEITLVTT